MHGLIRIAHRAAATAALSGAAFAASALPAAAADGGYSHAQAAAGATTFAANCASCHGQGLAGGSGPALVGASFHGSLQSNYGTAAKLYGFISKQMPLNAPGSLSSSDYLAVTAYVIEKNGFAAGRTALSVTTASHVARAEVTRRARRDVRASARRSRLRVLPRSTFRAPCRSAFRARDRAPARP